jgi:DNA polymerase-3 subunit beta
MTTKPKNIVHVDVSTQKAPVPKTSLAIVRPHVMRAMEIIASRETARYFLNGILIEPHKDGGIVLVATDGKIMVTLRDEQGYAEGFSQIWRFRDFAPIVKTKVAKASKGLKENANLRYEQQGHLFKVGLGFDSTPAIQAMAFDDLAYIGDQAGIDGSFPQYRRVIAKLGAKRTGASFSAQVVGQISKFAQELAGKAHARVRFDLLDENDPSAFRVEMPSEGLDAIGTIMPVILKGDPGMSSYPAWLSTHTDGAV